MTQMYHTVYECVGCICDSAHISRCIDDHIITVLVLDNSASTLYTGSKVYCVLYLVTLAACAY